MHIKKGLLIAMLALAPALFAQDNQVGQDAPEFKATVCVNQPDAITLEQCAGEVVLIKYWGTR
ncbi:MAG: hypothetical protein H6839_13110 [Planctomycetes bacterium]|nr:hypothetical protein [Planctomycetota bacterium]MCB9895383.1 hypothetical protein [Planctomycetota bacterium]